ncbi:hypothetical protein T440DRAFT_500268 [Plenodomus tracheiphilus IPT5]|uniref:Zn(2)-C6 fungal-type domain-containing protein n=1 Tax=Plenodomus tracheiphilus IPT5 TaxID=1408161 RepID=A0A6A7B3F4_9PLEO|nr:hypothetical protein T440DRAFT_500268 [Plenodomus tracheiphilus IPT5]
MSTTSPQYRAPSHYHHQPAGNHDNLYALATSTWPADPNLSHDSYTGPSAAQYLHYPPGGDGSAPLQPSNVPSAWASGEIRPELHEWQSAPADQSLPARSSVSYPPVASHHYQQRSSLDLNPAPALPLNRPDHHVSQQSTHAFETVRLPSEPSTNMAHAPFTALVLKQPVASQYPQAHLQISPLQDSTNSDGQLPSQAAAAWSMQPQYLEHPNSTYSTVATTAAQNSSSTSVWPVDTSSAVMAPPLYPRPQETSQEWTPLPVQHAYRVYDDQRNQLDSFTTAVLPQMVHDRPPPKKKAAKVPSSFVERQEKLKVSKRRGPLHEKQREKTHTMRKTKRICVRCRFYKSGCDEGDPCEKCDKITGHARSFREPCYREHLEDTSLVRRCNGREHQEEAEFLGYDWVQHSQLFEMEIMWNLPGYGPIPNAQPMRVTFRPYNPRRGSLDMAASLWTNKDGEIKSVQQPAYAVYDTASLVPTFERYFSSLQPAIEEWIFSRIRQDEVAYHTYQEVVRMRSIKGSKTLDLAMRLQCLSVVSQGYGSVWSNNIPGIREYDYTRLGRSDYEAYDRKSCDRPLPGAITHQMDVAAVKYLRKLEKMFVKEMAALIFKPRIKPWYELFLAFYVIFWNLEYIQHGAHDYIKSKNGTLIGNQVSNVVTTQIKKWEFAFPVLLYHWRCILRGYSPFKLARDNPEELREKGHIDAEGFEYVTRIANLFDRSDPDRFQPPLTGFAATHWSTSNEWIVKLFKEAGA